jgi:hypothetical protein
VFLAIRGLPGRPVALQGRFLARFAVAISAAIAVGLLLPVSDAVAAAAAAAVFATACALQRMVPVDVWSAIPTPRRA